MHDGQKRAMSRRNFLGSVGGVSTVAVATAATLHSTEVEAYDPGDEEARARYRETDHVKAFYRVNGYETLKK
ncbi:MAG TPA: twin-arginine translocation signal domain-containing protein [Alphaproteobacteria bacterium]|nr:twin-arginine translocation signal domain-containing protein [Alphaproteobacteria bacterium]